MIQIDGSSPSENLKNREITDENVDLDQKVQDPNSKTMQPIKNPGFETSPIAVIPEEDEFNSIHYQPTP